jgi:hypothetical protein
VPPRVRYGTTCLLIRDAVGGVTCSDGWEFGVVKSGHGTVTTPGNHSIAMVLGLP